MLKACEVCGKNFYGHGSRKYCLACRDEVYIKSRKESAKKRYAKRKGKRIRTKKPVEPPKPIVITPEMDEIAVRRLNGESLCMWCGNEFAAEKSSIRFCCDTHAVLFYDRIFSKL